MTFASYLKPLHGIYHLFFPRLCECCRHQLYQQEEVLCTQCELALPETNFADVPDNDAARLFYGRVVLSHVFSLAFFTPGGMMQTLLHGLKYDSRKNSGIWLGRLMGSRMMQAGWGSTVQCIVPVPLHPDKEAQRGYNQSELIAQGLAEAIGCPVETKLLLRSRKTESQTRKTRAQRAENMSGAFRVDAARFIAGQHILLCDDVLTTGATLEACAHALLHAGEVKISVATIAIAVA